MGAQGGRLSRRFVLRGFASAALAVALAAPPASASSEPAPEIAIGQLNAWRAMVGVGPVGHEPRLSRECRSHAAYYRVNPTQRFHREDPSLPAYSDAGDRAARSSVLAYNEAPTAGVTPWEPAPYHRMALLDPRLVSSGFWSEHGLSCMQVLAVSDDVRTPALSAYTYPVSGQRNVAPSFLCHEIPNPCDAVPNNDGHTPTGFNITVQFNGPWKTIDAVNVANATVNSGGQPPVDLVVQRNMPVLRGGIVLIPRHPLRAGETYTASTSGTVVGRGDDGTTAEHPFALSWDFSTPGIDPAASLRVVVERVTRTRVYLRLDLQSSDPRSARISLFNERRALVRTTRTITGPSQRITLMRPREPITKVAVLLRGSAKHIGVAARVATDIKAVRSPARVTTARMRRR